MPLWSVLLLVRNTCQQDKNKWEGELGKKKEKKKKKKEPKSWLIP